MRKTMSGLVLVITTGALLATTAGVPPSFASVDKPKPPTASQAEGGGVLRQPLEHPAAGLARQRHRARRRRPARRHHGDARPRRRNFADQLEMYDALTKRDPGSISRADIDQLYKREDFTPGDGGEHQVARGPGVTIQRDAFGVPFITGATFEDVEFGAGYAAIEDRMFLMDVLRHTGAARMAEFVGNTPGNVAMDQEQLRVGVLHAGRGERADRARRPRDAGAEGQQLLGGVDAFIAGINAAQDDLCPTVAGARPARPSTPRCRRRRPTGPAPTSSTSPRSSAASSARAAAARSRTRSGGRRSRRSSARRRRCGSTATCARRTTRRRRPRRASARRTTAAAFDPDLPGVALPDRDGATAPGTGAALRGVGARARDRSTPRLDLPDGVHVDLSELGAHGMSNALLVTGKESTTGKPLAVMGPQTGYYAPQLLVEQVLERPGHPGPRGLVRRHQPLRPARPRRRLRLVGDRRPAATTSTPSSRGSATPTARKATVELDRLPASARSACRWTVRRAQRDHARRTSPRPAAATDLQVPGAAHPARHRPAAHHGRRQAGRAGAPALDVRPRGRLGARLQRSSTTPASCTTRSRFQQAASDIDYTFNWFYADDKRHLLLLLRAAAEAVEEGRAGPAALGRQEVRLEGLAAVQAARPRDQPASAATWSAGTTSRRPASRPPTTPGATAPVYRSLALEKRLTAKIEGKKKVDLPGMVGVMAGGATADSRAAYTLPWLLKVIGNDPKTAAARGAAAPWLQARRAARRPGPRRRLRAPGRDRALRHLVGGRLAARWRTTRCPAGSGRWSASCRRSSTTTRGWASGSSFNGVAWYGYLSKDLRSVLGKKVDGAYSTGYCGKGSLKACRATLRASLAAAVARVLAEQGKSSVGQLTYDKHEDDIRLVTAGVVGVRPDRLAEPADLPAGDQFLGHR